MMINAKNLGHPIFVGTKLFVKTFERRKGAKYKGGPSIQNHVGGRATPVIYRASKANSAVSE